jgi:mycoredoxin
MTEKMIVYGTEWCGDTRRAKKILDEHKIDYEYINIDHSPEAKVLVKKINNGYASVPTIIFPDGSILVEPTNVELKEKLIEFKYIE